MEHDGPAAAGGAPAAQGDASSRGRGGRWASAAYGASVAVACALALVFGRDAGAIWDDEAQLVNGENVLRWFRSGFADRSALTTQNYYLYGALFDAPAQLLVRISPWGPVETRHLLTSLLGVLGIVAVFEIAALVSGRRAGVLAAALLLLTPVWLGHALMNAKDVPFAAFAAWALYAAVRVAVAKTGLSTRDALLAGACVGAAAGVRSGGMFLFGYVVLAAVGRTLLARREGGPRGRAAVPGVATRLGLALLVAWALMISFWPWAQLAPLTRPFQAAAETTRFQWGGDVVLFDGAWYATSELPRSYLPTWFARALPETWGIAAACAIAAAVVSVRRRATSPRKLLAIAILALAALGPVAAAVLLRPVMYDAQRHFLFVLPPAAAVCGVGLAAFGSSSAFPRWARGAVVAVLSALALLTIRDIVRLHPYEYVYVNRAAGGLRGAVSRYETDYWGASYREGAEWLIRNVEPPRPLRVAGCSDFAQLAYYLWTPAARDRFQPVPASMPADVFLATTRWSCHERPGKILHVVEREGVPLLYVIATSR